MKTFLSAIALLAVAAGAALYGLYGRSRTIAHAFAPDGSEVMLRQNFNWSPELFTTSFHHRRNGGTWEWFYYDHQDVVWNDAPLEIDPVAKRITIWRNGQPTIYFDWETTTYTLLNRGSYNRQIIGGQATAPASGPLPKEA